MNFSVVDREVNALAKRVGSSQRAKMLELEELLPIRDQLKKEIEGDFRHGFRTLVQISAGWDEFYRINGGWLRWNTLGVGDTDTQVENPSPCHEPLLL